MKVLANGRLARPRARLAHGPADFSDPLAVRLQWLAAEIVAAYSATTDAEVVAAVRDWIHRHAIHPYPPFHTDVPAGLGAETVRAGVERSELPATWLQAKIDADSAFWGALGFNGYYMLCLLLSLDPATGLYDAGRNGGDTGMMERVGAAHWRMLDVGEYRTVLCSYQVVMCMALYQALGYHAMHISTVGHDPFVVWIPSEGRWIYQCPTYGEEFRLDSTSGRRLSPRDLVALSVGGQKARAVRSVATPPSWATGPFMDVAWDSRMTYWGDGHPDGMVVMGSNLTSQDGRLADEEPLLVGANRVVQVDLPGLVSGFPAFANTAVYARARWEEAFPYLGCVVVGVEVAGETVTLSIASGQPGAAEYERSVNGGAWASCYQSDTLARGTGSVRYRSLDGEGRPSSAAEVSV